MGIKPYNNDLKLNPKIVYTIKKPIISGSEII